jgi:hypothetical protein
MISRKWPGFFSNNMPAETEGFPPQADQHRHWPLKRPV